MFDEQQLINSVLSLPAVTSIARYFSLVTSNRMFWFAHVHVHRYLLNYTRTNTQDVEELDLFSFMNYKIIVVLFFSIYIYMLQYIYIYMYRYYHILIEQQITYCRYYLKKNYIDGTLDNMKYYIFYRILILKRIIARISNALYIIICSNFIGKY